LRVLQKIRSSWLEAPQISYDQNLSFEARVSGAQGM
jgi:hypothetical protein